MRILRLLALSAVLSLGATAPTPAQVTGGVVFIPPVTPNHCAAWNSPNVLKDSGGSCGGSGSPGGSNTQLQYNNSGSFGGISGATTNGTAVTVAPNDLLLTGSSSGTATLNAPATGGGTLTLPPGSVGIVGGPASSTNGHVATFNGTGGNIIQDGGALPTGTVTSVGTGAGLTGGVITTSGTISTTELIRAVTTTSDTILSSDAAKLVTYSNGSAIAVTLPQATGSFAAGFAFSVQNLGAGTVTITPTTSTINGASTLAVTTNQGCDIVSDGTNWQVSACTAVVPSGGSGTVNSGTAGNGAYYATSTTAVSDGGSVTVNFGGVQVSSGSSSITNGLRLISANTPCIYASSACSIQTTSGLITLNNNAAASNINSFEFLDSAASSTSPTFVPNRQSTSTGVGAQASGNMSFIVGGVEKSRYTGEGLQYKQATAPTVSGTGTPTIATGSTDEAGEVTAGSTAISVVITFNLTHTNAPFCVVTPQSVLATFSFTLSNTAITITQTATSGDKIDYRCTFP